MPEVGATRAMPEDRRGGMPAAAPCLLRLAQHGPGHPRISSGPVAACPAAAFLSANCPMHGPDRVVVDWWLCARA